MLSNKKWFAFFHNINIKQHLLTLFVTYLSPDDFAHSSPFSILVNNKNKIFETSGSVTKVFECSHEEVDTRMIFHALQQQSFPKFIQLQDITQLPLYKLFGKSKFLKVVVTVNNSGF